MTRVEGEAEIADESAAFRVPRVLRTAEIVCADGRRLRGRVFLPAAAEAHPGPMRAEEWLNDRADFFPFLPDGEGSLLILNKQETLMVTVPAAADHDGTLEEVATPFRRVVLECGSARVEGEVAIDMPAGHSRLLDLLNRDRAFLTVRDGELHHLVRRSRITQVREVRGEGGRS
jgi:hypothetical protein